MARTPGAEAELGVPDLAEEMPLFDPDRSLQIHMAGGPEDFVRAPAEGDPTWHRDEE